MKGGCEKRKMELSRTDAYIIKTLAEFGVINPITAMKSKEITQAGVTERTIYHRLVRLVDVGMTAYGLTDNKAKTFYLTPEGLEFYNSVISKVIQN